MSKVKSALLGIGVASITATGAWYGAGLKTRQEITQERLSLAEATIEERIARLESMLARLGVQRNELEKKIADAEARRSRHARNDG